MKNVSKIPCLSLGLLLALASCGSLKTTSSKSSEEPVSEKSIEDSKENPISSENQSSDESHESVESHDSIEDSTSPMENQTYNIILAAATVPPVLGALHSIENGYETYAWIERGKTFLGIEDTSFHNIGFDSSNNANAGITREGFRLTIEKVRELNQQGCFFNFFVTDYKVMSGVKAAIESGLNNDQWHIYMASDGSATAEYFERYYISGQTDASSYARYNADLAQERERISAAYTSYAETGSAGLDDIANEYVAGYRRCIPLAGDSRFTLLSQTDLSKKAREGYRLGSIFKGDGVDEESANVIYKTIDEHVNGLNEAQKNEYLTLMVGDYREEIQSTFERTTLSDGVTPAPKKKLVFVGGRIRQSGIGRFTPLTEPLSGDYDDLPERLYEVFERRSDYEHFLSFLADEGNWNGLERRKKESPDATSYSYTPISVSAIPAEKKEEIVLALTNYYIDYTYNLRFAYRNYGQEYDILLKGHPREDFSGVDAESWTYVTSYTQNEGDGLYYAYDYRQLTHDLMEDFHLNDSEGKHVGLLPFGVAAENLVYVGGDVSYGGLLSSTYSGLSNDTPILFLLANDEDNATTYSMTADKFDEFGLTWEREDGEVRTTYFNKANLSLNLYSYYAQKAANLDMDFSQDVALSLSQSYYADFRNKVPQGSTIDCFGRIYSSVLE